MSGGHDGSGRSTEPPESRESFQDPHGPQNPENPEDSAYPEHPEHPETWAGTGQEPSGPGRPNGGPAGLRLASGLRRALRRHSAPVTHWLIGLCTAVFVISPVAGFGYGTGDRLIAAQHAYFARWGVVPDELLAGVPHALLTPVTALFVHGSWLHLLGNMLFLYVFGAMVEERLGPVRFTLFYLCCGALALCAYALAHAGSAQSLVGASGAISAVLGAFLRLFPKARVTSLFPFLLFLPLRFPAWVVLPFWVTLQWLALGQSGHGPGVAYLAHLVGFALGFGYAWLRCRGESGAEPSGGEPATAPLE